MGSTTLSLGRVHRQGCKLTLGTLCSWQNVSTNLTHFGGLTPVLPRRIPALSYKSPSHYPLWYGRPMDKTREGSLRPYRSLFALDVAGSSFSTLRLENQQLDKIETGHSPPHMITRTIVKGTCKTKSRGVIWGLQGREWNLQM